MIPFDRSCVPAPESLSIPSASVANEMADAIAYYAQNAPGMPGYKAFEFKAYKEWDVKQALRKIFYGKCAYCETNIGAPNSRDVEHYRPKGAVTGQPLHPGYWWLAHCWDNLLPACRGCNMSLRQHIVAPTMTPQEVEAMMCAPPRTAWGKANHFPIGANRATCSTDDLDDEDAYLIDPTKRDPEPEFNWLSSNHYSIAAPSTSLGVESPYGRETIKCCALNRVELVQARTSVLNELRLQRTKIMDELELGIDDPDRLEAHLQRAVERAAELRRYYEGDRLYAGMAKAFVKEFERELHRWQTTKARSLVEDAHA